MDPASVFAALDEAGVRFVIVGGLAVVAHGHARLTVDTDLVIDLDEEPAVRAMDALVALGLEARAPVDPRQFADPKARRSWIEDKGMLVFSFFDPRDQVPELDVFVEYPVPFEELFARSVEKTVGGRPVRVASIDDLIGMKRRAGRPKDLEDIEELEALRDE
jgi:predicted nucleotidyltransferase